MPAPGADRADLRFHSYLLWGDINWWAFPTCGVGRQTITRAFLYSQGGIRWLSGALNNPCLSVTLHTPSYKHANFSISSLKH